MKCRISNKNEQYIIFFESLFPPSDSAWIARAKCIASTTALRNATAISQCPLSKWNHGIGLQPFSSS